MLRALAFGVGRAYSIQRLGVCIAVHSRIRYEHTMIIID